MSIDGQGTLWRRNIAENFNRLSRAHERYRQTTDRRTITYSEHELEFTFAKKLVRKIKGVKHTIIRLHHYGLLDPDIYKHTNTKHRAIYNLFYGGKNHYRQQLQC